MAHEDAATLDRRLGGIPELYGAIWSDARAAATRWHLAIVIEIAMIVAWFAIRSTAGVDGRFYAMWVIAAGVLALVAPLSGLVVFVATSVFYEPDTIPRIVPPRVWVLVPLAVGVLIRIAADRLRWRPAVAIWLALLILLGTALAVVHSFDRFPDEIAWRAARSWFNNMAGPVILLVAAAWTARGGSMRVLVVACAVAVVGALVSMAEHASPGVVSAGPFAWVGFWKDYGPRLAGTIPSPNAQAAQWALPTAVLLSAVLLARDLRLKIVALAALVPLLIANYLTFSRSPLLSGYAFAVIVAWRFRRWAGIAVLVAGLVASAVLLPRYLQLRAESVGGAEVLNGSIVTAADQNRILTWGTAVQMWREAPLTGQGFLAYKTLAPSFGDEFFGSPHNEWLRLFAESGTIVGLLGLAFIALSVRSLSRVPGWLGTGLLAGFVGFVIAASFNNPFLFIRVSAVAFSMIGVGLALATGRVPGWPNVVAEDSEAQDPDPPGDLTTDAQLAMR